MSLAKPVFPSLPPIAGFRLGVASAGIKQAGRKDVVLMELAADSSLAAVFTRNAFCAAPVQVAREHLKSDTSRYLLVNTGNANAGTGGAGVDAARACCAAVAEATACRPQQVLPFSTGVIGEPLPTDRILAALPTAIADLSGNNWRSAAEGILTTDTVPKGAWRSVEIDGGTITIAGISKGAGMIRPDMATMLAFIATDARIEQPLLQAALQKATGVSFNRITIDGDTSTNDSCILAATGQSGCVVQGGEMARFEQALNEVCLELAQAIVRDGEGATKFVTVAVHGGRDVAECERVAFTVAHSPLVKTALFASDPNWGRILAAVGRAGVEGMDLDAIVIHLGDVCIVENGGRSPRYTEADGRRVMALDEITVEINLARGNASARVWTCDFSYDYVRINAEYRT